MNQLCIRECSNLFKRISPVYQPRMLGSCLGTMTGHLLTSVSGDLSHFPKWTSGAIDSALIISPLLMLNLYPKIGFFWILFLILMELIIFIFPIYYRKYFIFKIFFPLLLSFGCCLVGPSVPSLTSPLCGIASTAGLSFVISIVCSDIGFKLNDFIRSGLVSMGTDSSVVLSIKAMLIGLSLYLDIFSLNLLYPNYFWIFSILLIIGISIFSNNPQSQKGSIVSSTFCIFITTCTAFQIVTAPSIIAGSAVYNNLYLNEVEEILPHHHLPLLEPDDVQEQLSSQQITDLRFRYLTNALLLFATLNDLDSPIFLNTGFSVYIWVLLAPYIISDRIF
jgi:hypothetical protein